MRLLLCQQCTLKLQAPAHVKPSSSAPITTPPTRQILVLDEVTSALDVASERAISDTLRHLGATKLIIAHRQDGGQLAAGLVVGSNDVPGCSRSTKCDQCHPVVVGVRAPPPPLPWCSPAAF